MLAFSSASNVIVMHDNNSSVLLTPNPIQLLNQGNIILLATLHDVG